jgi:toxin ParE1/3/4
MAKQYEVKISPQAERDLEAVSEWIIDQSGFVRTALNYIRRIRAFISGLKNFPHRGTKRDDLYPGIRIVGFERRASIVCKVTGDTVLIARIFYGGRDIEALMADDEGLSG